jgi:hypothetical protein
MLSEIKPSVMLNACVAGIAALLVGCGEPPKEIARETRTFQLLSQRQPKHYAVQLKDVKTQEVFSTSVSKHCNNYRQNRIGDYYDLQVITYQTSKGSYKSFNGLEVVFCGGQTKGRPTP